MSLYNLINGVQQETFFFLPMLGKHPDEYPRFRDCCIGRLENDAVDKDQFGIPVKIRNCVPGAREISVYTRVGGGNREEYSDEIAALRAHPNYVMDYDDSFDSTFATFVFSAPKQWQSDYDKLLVGNFDISAEYKSEMYRIYPKLKEQFDVIFNEK